MKVPFENEFYVVQYMHNTLDSFLRNINVVYGNPKMGVHSASGKDLQSSKHKKCLKQAFKPLMKHFKFELGTFCMIKKWEEKKEETPTFAQEDPLAFEFTRLSKKDTYFKKKGRSEATDKALAVMFPGEVTIDPTTQEEILDPATKKRRRTFKKAIMAACAAKSQKKPVELAKTAEAKE